MTLEDKIAGFLDGYKPCSQRDIVKAFKDVVGEQAIMWTLYCRPERFVRNPDGTWRLK